MEQATEILAIIWAFTVEIFRSPANYAILVVAWFAVEITGPVLRFLVSLPRVTRKTRLQLYGLLRHGKRIGSTLWCLILTWVPYAQPDLCGPGRLEGCQTIMSRLAVAVVLGGGLALGHRAIAARLRKAFGVAKLHRITCSNCRKGIKVTSLEDPCPECSEVPHEVTTRS